MPGRWSDERERGWEQRRREADWRERERFQGREARSFESSDDEAYERNDRGLYEPRDERVFGERESGAGYNRPQRDVGGAYRGGRGDGDRPGWQDRDYGGVSPAFRGHEHDYDSGYRANPRFERHDYTRSEAGGRFYGDDGRSRLYREEYAYGGGDAPQRFGSRAADERYAQALRRGGPDYSGGGRYGTWSGGTGGYDYERGYGDGGRGGDGHRDFEDRARDAGEFFRRTGRKISNWFADVAGEGSEMGGDERAEARGARGLGPKGYKRSDERISDDAHQRLTDDPWLDASEIGVSVSGGEVTLSGTVASREAKHRAERLVEDLSGVNHVQNNLRIRPGNYFTSAGRGYGDSVENERVRTEGDASMETSANATGTTSRPKAT